VRVESSENSLQFLGIRRIAHWDFPCLGTFDASLPPQALVLFAWGSTASSMQLSHATSLC
jgi:hypothetical protein